MTSNKSPLTYPGGKTRACKVIEKVVNEYFDIETFDKIISPFFGGGSFEFHMQNKYNLKLTVNDKFTPLYNFWKQVKNDKTVLCEELRKVIQVSKDDFMNYRKIIMTLNDNILEQALYYFILNRCSFNGSILSSGYSLKSSKTKFTQSSINNIELLDFTNIDIYNKDFTDFINDIDNEDENKRLMFLDPPLYGDIYENFNHQLLFELIKTKRNWIMTYNNCDYIKSLYKDFIIIELKYKYDINIDKKISEIIILSI
jgi:DNA adenine methylase